MLKPVLKPVPKPVPKPTRAPTPKPTPKPTPAPTQEGAEPTPEDFRPRPNVASFNLVISACEAAGQAEPALELLAMMQDGARQRRAALVQCLRAGVSASVA